VEFVTLAAASKAKCRPPRAHLRRALMEPIERITVNPKLQTKAKLPQLAKLRAWLTKEVASTEVPENVT